MQAKKKYQVAVTLEDGSIVSDIVNNTYAGTPIARVEGNYSISDIIKYDRITDKVVAIPGLILTGGVLVDLTNSNVVKYIVDKGNNLPYPVGGMINTTPDNALISYSMVTKLQMTSLSTGLSSLGSNTDSNSLKTILKGLVTSTAYESVQSSIGSSKVVDNSVLQTVDLNLPEYVSSNSSNSSSNVIQDVIPTGVKVLTTTVLNGNWTGYLEGLKVGSNNVTCDGHSCYFYENLGGGAISLGDRYVMLSCSSGWIDNGANIKVGGNFVTLSGTSLHVCQNDGGTINSGDILVMDLCPSSLWTDMGYIKVGANAAKYLLNSVHACQKN